MKQNAVLSSIAVASLLFFQACSRNEVSSTSKRDDAKSGLNDKNQDHSVGPPPTHFAYFEIYEGNDGKTHFRDVAIDLELTNFAPPAPPLGISESHPQVILDLPAQVQIGDVQTTRPVCLTLLPSVSSM